MPTVEDKIFEIKRTQTAAQPAKALAGARLIFKSEAGLIKAQISRIAAALLLLAFCFLPVYMHLSGVKDDFVGYAKLEDAGLKLSELKQSQDALLKEASILEKKAQILKSNAVSDEVMLSDVEAKFNSEEITELLTSAGLKEIKGAGIRIELADKEGYQHGVDDIRSIVHDSNLRHILWLLINSGAEAVSINDMRITNTSGIYCAGSTVILDGERLSPPYIFEAAGPQTEMFEALSEDAENRFLQEHFALQISLQKIDEILIPAQNDLDYIERHFVKNLSVDQKEGESAVIAFEN